MVTPYQANSLIDIPTRRLMSLLPARIVVFQEIPRIPDNLSNPVVLWKYAANFGAGSPRRSWNMFGYAQIVSARGIAY